MSRHNFRAFAFLLAAPLCGLVTLASAALWTSCDLNGGSDGGLDKYFLRDVAAMQAMGLPVYWLGTEFTVDGHEFRGPYVPEFGAEVEGGGIDMTYLASLPDGGAVPLDLFVYGTDAWELARDRITNPSVPGVTRRALSVGDREGELLFLPLDTTPLNILRLVMYLDDMVVVAQARSLTAPAIEGGVELSPFINNPDLLVQVMKGLRPYPE